MSFVLPKRPKIGLALGSGIARGWAHIGVVRALVKAGFAPDVVVGTSIGAVVGGAYVANYLQEIEEFAHSLTARKIFGLLDISFGGSSIFGGRKIANELYKHMADIKIESLHKKFIAVATELTTGHEIWLQHGSLVDALRASYALPGVFAPVHIDGRWLIDGALVNPVPTSVCRAFDSRLVIAVNLNRDAFGKASTSQMTLTDEDFAETQEAIENIADVNPDNMSKNNLSYRAVIKQLFSSSPRKPGMTTILLSSLNIVQDRLARSRLAGDPADININPKVGHISLLEFNRVQEAIELGEAATEQMLPEIESAAKILF
jgi:NTE family protein